MNSMKAAGYFASHWTSSCLNWPLVTPLLNGHHLFLSSLPLSQSWTPHMLTQSLLFQKAIGFQVIPRCTLRPAPMVLTF